MARTPSGSPWRWWAQGRELQFLVDPVGSNAQGTSWNIYVSPGQQVRLTVPPQFAR